MNTTLLEAVFNNLLTLLPLRIVHSFERGVKFRFGRDVAELQPGVHWFWPFLESIEVVNTAPEVKNLLTQTVTTKDGHSVTLSANVCYKIVNARVMYTSVQAFDEAMEAFAMVYLARAISRATLLQLKRQRAAVEKNLARALTNRVKHWGARIEWVGLTDLTEAKAYRLFGDPNAFRVV